MFAAPGHNPDSYAAEQVAVLSSQHRPLGCFRLQSVDVAGGCVIIRDVVDDASVPTVVGCELCFVPLGQHMMLAPPGHRPDLNPPSHSTIDESQHSPDVYVCLQGVGLGDDGGCVVTGPHLALRRRTNKARLHWGLVWQKLRSSSPV